MKDEYIQLPTPDGLEPCPCCGADAEMWQYEAKVGEGAQKAVMCSTAAAIGPQDALIDEGCPLSMPPMSHYMATQREAARYWNEYSRAMCALQRSNRWQRAQVLRGGTAV